MDLKKLFKERSDKFGPESDGKLGKTAHFEQILEEIQVRYRKLLNHTQAIQYAHDLQGQFLSVDEEITEFLGYDRNTLLDMNIRLILSPEVRHRFDTYLSEIKRQGVSKGLMFVQTISGEKRVLKYFNTLRTEGVTIPFVQGIAYDVTEQKQTRKTLKQLSEQLSVILESLPIVCYIGKAEEDYGATYITHNVKAITGFEQTDFTSKSSFWADRIHPEDASRIFADLPQISTKGYHEHQYRWQVADGSYKWFYDYRRLMKSSDGKKYIIGMMQDITERKKTEEALLNAAQQWRTTFDGINDFVSLLDLDGKILRCNKAMKDFVGKPFDEIINHSCWEIILGATTPNEGWPFLRMKETLHRETTTLSANGLWLDVSVDPIFDQAGRLIGAVNIISDVTKRKQAEEAVTRLSQQNAIMAEIGRIISSTLNIDEVYERFSQEVRKLIPFDRIEIITTNPQDYTITIAYITGIEVRGRNAGDTIPMLSTAVQEVSRTRTSQLIQSLNIEALERRFPPLLSSFEAGLRSMIFVPLISEDRVIGALSLKTTKPDFYTERDLRLTERVGNQIAGAVANARLFTERKQAEEKARRNEENLQTLMDASPMAISWGDINGNVRYINCKFRELFGYTVEDIPTIADWRRLAYPDSAYRETIPSLLVMLTEAQKQGREPTPTEAIITCKDGSRRHVEQTGAFASNRILAIYKDITERKRAEESLKKSEEEAKRLSQENEIMAEIGRIVSSTLNIDEVYELFAEEVRKLIPIDRMTLSSINADGHSATITYVWGPKVQSRNQGDVFPLEGSLVEMALIKRSGILILMKNEEALARSYPTLINTFRTGFRSLMSVPLISKDQVIGVLVLHGFRVDAYTDPDLRMAERVANQIAGAVANAHLYAERKHAEEEAAKLARENAVVAEIGRIVTSTLNIDEVYERFAEEVRKLIDFNRIVINVIDIEKATITNVYMAGKEILDRKVEETYPLKGSGSAEMVRTKSSLLIQTEDFNEYKDRFPMLFSTFQAGFRSMMNIPLFSKGRIVGGLLLRSLKPYAYTDGDLKLAERVGNQIAGAIANAQLFAQRKRAEEAAAKSAKENATMAEIGRIVSSTLNVEEVYERFAEEVRKLIPFDRIGIQTVNTKNNTTTLDYISGVDVESRRAGDVISLEATAVGECVRTRSSLLFQTESEEEVLKRFPNFLPTFKAGLQSMICVPLISKNHVIGILHVLSIKPNAYTESDVKLAERVGNQIAGAIANAQLFVERKRMESALRKSETKFRDLYDNAPVGYQEYDNEGRVTNVNDKELVMLGYSAEEMIGRHIWEFNVDPDIVREKVLAKLSGTASLGRNLERVYRKKDESPIPVLIEERFVFDEHGQRKGIRCTVQDITQRKEIDKALQRSEEEAKRLSQENAIMAEIGRVISSTLNIEAVYERFAEEVRKLIPFDRIAVTTINPKDQSSSVAYAWGTDVSHRKQGEIFSVANLFYKRLITTRAGILAQAENETELAERYPELQGVIHAGFRSMISVPLISKDEVIGALHVRSLKPNAYTEADLKLAERVGNQIAGAVANAQLFTERKRAEEKVARLSQENAIVAEIGRIISSTLNIDEVYERFAQELRKLIFIDRVSLSTINPDGRSATIAYSWGSDIENRKRGDVFPLKGTLVEKTSTRRSGILVEAADEETFIQTYPTLSKSYRAGFRSFISVPLISKDEVIGILILHTLKEKVYTEQDIQLAERIGNQIAGAIANAQLFAERKRAEEALRKSEAKFQELFDEAPVGYQEIDSEGRIVRINRTELDMLGYTAEEMFSKSLREFIPDEESRQKVEGKLAGTIPTGIAFERVFQRKDGTTFSAVMQDRVLRDSKGKITGILATVQDVTERKRSEEEKALLQEQLRQSQKMEAIGKLAGGVAHDFNNLLTVIHGYSELLLNSLDQESRLRQDVQEITHASERASSLTRQLLAFSRKQVLQPKVLDLNAHVSNMDKMLRRMIGEDIELVTLLAKDLGRIKADPGQIEQVILNLAVNAKDAMQNGGRLTIETANARLDENYARSRIGVTPGDYVMLSMSDTGVGMSPETRERIFEPFFTTKEKGKGTGLGLSTVYGIVQQSGGNIWVYSEQDLGTTFKTYLPRIDERAESLRPVAVSNKLLQGSETVLLVEDEEMVRKLACTVLEKNGYRVLEASNGDEALDVVQGRDGNPIHLVLTDVVMPGMSGRQLADRLVALRPEIKILYMSGYTDDAIVHHGVLDPGIAYIQKPFTPDALASKVRETLDGN